MTNLPPSRLNQTLILFEEAIGVELVSYRYALPPDDKRCFFRSREEAQALVDKAVKDLSKGVRAEVSSIHATRTDLEQATAIGAKTCLYFRIWGLLVELQMA